ncbi:MAG: alanine/glycine:cation symporter family protein [bacterium]
MENIQSAIAQINDFVWGPPMLALLLVTGLYLTFGLRLMSIVRIPYAFGQLFKKRTGASEGDVSPFAALMTALSSTIGTGNIAGVAAAIAIGGPGAILWMWITAIVGTATKYAEGVLAVKFREVDADGRHVGGPMYYIKNGLGKGWVWLGGLFALLGVLASWGTGAYIQSQSIGATFETNYNFSPILTGLVIAALAAAVILGGIKRISTVASKLVPFMALTYMLAGLTVIGLNIDAVPAAFVSIFKGAMGIDAVTGGVSGALIWLAMQKGVARGIFSNEAGQGSAPIAHAAAQNKDPVNQGIVAMLGTFIDTLIVCTVTALVILTANIIPPECSFGTLFTTGATPDQCLIGGPLTSAAFENSLPGAGGHIVAIGLAIFAFTTILGWSYYGERCAEYLFGEKIVLPFRISWIIVVFLGSWILTVDNEGARSIAELSWLAADTLTGMMAAPNLVALLLLSPLVFKLTKEYFEKDK